MREAAASPSNGVIAQCVGKLLALKSRRGRVRSLMSPCPAGTMFEEGDFAHYPVV